jgi:hypothetical protein
MSPDLISPFWNALMWKTDLYLVYLDKVIVLTKKRFGKHQSAKKWVDEITWPPLNVARLDLTLLKYLNVKYRIKFDIFRQSNSIDKIRKKRLGMQQSVKQSVDEITWYHLNVARLDLTLLKCFDVKDRLKWNSENRNLNFSISWLRCQKFSLIFEPARTFVRKTFLLKERSKLLS